jgi:hypothetical protein
MGQSPAGKLNAVLGPIVARGIKTQKMQILAARLDAGGHYFCRAQYFEVLANCLSHFDPLMLRRPCRGTAPKRS